ncbi:hypothetical protein D3C71_2148760 [compost metagenome]
MKEHREEDEERKERTIGIIFTRNGISVGRGHPHPNQRTDDRRSDRNQIGI